MKYLIIPLFYLSLCTAYAQTKKDVDKISAQNLTNVADNVHLLMLKHHYNPKELESSEYLKLDNEVHQLAKTAQTKKEFTEGFNKLWADGPFSHVSLQLSQMKAADMAEYFDAMKVGAQGVSLEWTDKTAVLKVNTMMGVDTYERIIEFYQEIEDKQAEALVIDVRNNPGGAFAIVPLVGHVLTEAVDVGMFVSNSWWNKNEKAPRKSDIKDLQSWEGWTLKSFWHDVQEQALTRVTFKPLNPIFNGPVYVLVNGKSASATEFAVDALANLDNVTIIGETTAGNMLSQKMYDLPNGFQLSLPIAEYYSTRIGRIEGKGVKPDLVIESKGAKHLAMLLINGEKPKKALKKALEALKK